MSSLELEQSAVLEKSENESENDALKIFDPKCSDVVYVIASFEKQVNSFEIIKIKIFIVYWYFNFYF